MEDLATFYSTFMQQAHEDSEIQEVPIESALTENILEYVKEANETNSPEVICIESDNDSPKSFGQFRINAFDYSDMEGELDLFVTLYKDSDIVVSVNNNQIDGALNRAVRFLNLAITGALSKNYRDSKPEVTEIADMIRDEYAGNRIEQIKFFVLTNGKLKEEWTIDDLEQTDQKIPTEYHIWTIEDVLRAEQTTRQMNEINIVLDNPVECIKINDSNEKVNTYLGIISALDLAKIYSKYKDKLIDQNVRNYLGGKIKVNQKIAKTLREAPEMFFSYNNGISSTASDVTLAEYHNDQDDLEPRKYIIELRNWHIVNGGQTTCTIYNAYKKNVDVSKAFVTMKVSELKNKLDNDGNEIIVRNIAESANSQTQIKDSDLSANSNYLISIDKISKNEWTPQQSARPNTLWYFERLRGQLLSDKLNVGDSRSAKVRKFLQERPKEQLLTKTDVAKVMMAWDELPQESSKGNEVCFNNFWNKHDYKTQEVTREYFHEIVAKRIIYITIHNTFKAAGHSGYANIVDNYVLAAIAWKTQENLDLNYIWQNQAIQPELKEPISECIEIVVNEITKLAQSGINPTVIAKKSDFWNTIKIQLANVKFPTNGSIMKPISKELTDEQQDTIKKVKSIGPDNWAKLSAWGKETHKMSIMEKKRIDHMIVALQKNPDSILYSAAESCMKILRMSKDSGFILED